MKGKIFLLLLSITVAMVSFSQTTRQVIDKAAKDPHAKENAAKADVLLHDKKVITDSSALLQQPAHKKKKKHTKRCS
ncbi:MAG: hypothetical protein ACTHOF_13625 [Flavisolibacter sp.]